MALLKDGTRIYGNAIVDGNISVSQIYSGGNTWTFGTNGATTFPGNLTVLTNPLFTGTIISQADALVQLFSTGDNAITVMGWSQYETVPGEVATVSFNNDRGNIILTTGNIAAVAHEWDYRSDGTLLLPAGGVIAEGTTSIPNVATVTNIELVPYGGSDQNQRLVIYPTAVEGNHVHLTSGNLQVTDIFLGDDAQFFKTNTDGGMSVGTGVGPGGSGGNVWTFGTDGSLTFPDSTVQTTGYVKKVSGYNVQYPVVTMDNFVAAIDNAGNPTVAAVTGTFGCYYTLQFTEYVGPGWTTSTYGGNGSFSSLFGSGIGVTFANAGDMVVGTFQDTSSGHVYQTTWIATPTGPSTGYGSIVIERLI